jgi:peptidyl-prolyl cis-trans isomerase A (cyclophilin A)
MKARWTQFVYYSSLTLLMSILIGCGGSAPTASISGNDSDEAATSEEPSGGGTATLAASSAATVTAASVAPKKNMFPEVVIKTSAGDVRVRLNAEKAPVTVENFLENYVDRDFYNNTVFHHVDPGYILGGGYTTDLDAKEVRAPIRNESMNGLKNTRGTITMSRSPDYSNSATSQFFINVTPAESLDYNEDENEGYCVFGEVIQGMEVVDKIAKMETHASGDFPKVPVDAVVVNSIERIE